MTHPEFVAAYARGEIRIQIDPRGAGRHLSARLLLPFVTMPVLGIGVALALVGWVFSGFAVIAFGIIAPQLVKRSAPQFLLTQALESAAVYEEATQSGVLRITPVSRIPSPPVGGEG
ncbi:MAG TPA: hypothetical protein VGA12_01485 [Burkholderiales bacterium]|jgi:hypothetical protein